MKSPRNFSSLILENYQVSLIKIALLSDTHGYLDTKVTKYLSPSDEIWHAGDIGSLEIASRISSIKPLRAVYGNIDDKIIRNIYPENQIFEVEGIKVWMTHIGGYPPRYTSSVKKKLAAIRPGLFICGHSHIAKAISDHANHLLHLNPGAAGNQGFHKIRTMMRFSIDHGKITDLQVIELGKRGAVE